MLYSSYTGQGLIRETLKASSPSVLEISKKLDGSK